MYFHINSCSGTKSGKPVRFYLNIFRGLNRRRRNTLISIHPHVETKPNKSVRFHLHSNFYAKGKPDKLAHFCIDSLRKPSRTNRWASAQLPHSEAKPDNPVRFHTKSFPRVKRAIPVHSQYKSSFGS